MLSNDLADTALDVRDRTLRNAGFLARPPSLASTGTRNGRFRALRGGSVLASVFDRRSVWTEEQ
jgi:hypothetical protein